MVKGENWPSFNRYSLISGNLSATVPTLADILSKTWKANIEPGNVSIFAVVYIYILVCCLYL